jgi:hypothetical protein
MSQKHVAIVGHNNTQAQVTGQEELLVKMNSLGTATGTTRVPVLIRVTTSGTIAPIVYSISVSNVGTANGTFLGGTIKAGETLNFDAGALNNFYAAGTITYNGTGTELVIIYNI